MDAKKVAFRSLGCKVNEYELDVMQQKMSENGFLIVPFDTKADIYVVNTCTVTNIADRKSRQMLHRAKKINPNAIVVAVGCYVQTDLKKVMEDYAVDIAIGNNHKADIADIINDYLSNMDNSQSTYSVVSDLTYPTNFENMHIFKTSEHTRAFMKIQDGCNQFCSYCAIPYARGRIRSKQVKDIVEEAYDLSENGYKEVVLTGIHLSSYGLDFHPDSNGKVISYNEMSRQENFNNTDLLTAIEEVAKIDKIKRIRLGSLEPNLITEEFVKRLSKIDKLCPHFHLSLQSGCDETLKRMNRKYTTEEFENAVSVLRRYFNMPAITTDVIVGFPGESDEEFNETLEFLKKIKFFEMHIFKYSKRKNTVAAKLNNQVSDEIKDIRSETLLKLDKELSEEFRKAYIGREVEVLFEKYEDGRLYGYTKEYISVEIEHDSNIAGQIQTLCFNPK